jgi:FlaA1/EpsC-like NDP-sugar epimerase
VASTRFANVAFSDGSLLAGFLHRIEKRQPLAGPSDVRRYFISEEEAGQLCLLTAALAGTRQVFVPRRDPHADTRRFDEIAEIVVRASGFEPRWYDRFDDAAAALTSDLVAGRYPCCFGRSDTSGEKDLEEFVAPDERLAASPFEAIDVIGESPDPGAETIAEVVRSLAEIVAEPSPATCHARIAELLERAVPAFEHVETGRNLDQKA